MKAHPLKIVRIEVEDILFDPEEVSGMLMSACSRNGVSRFAAGLCDSGDGSLVIPLEIVREGFPRPESYCFAPFPDASFEGVSAELQIRHVHGLSLVGTFRLSDGEDMLWGLYVRYSQKA